MAVRGLENLPSDGFLHTNESCMAFAIELFEVVLGGFDGHVWCRTRMGCMPADGSKLTCAYF